MPSCDQVRRKVGDSRSEQGLPPTVEDPAALERAAAAFRVMAVGPAVPTQRTGNKSAGVVATT